jgi:deoxycytidylate deaminase
MRGARAEYMAAAAAEARRSSCRHQHGAVLVRNRSIVARGHNKYVRGWHARCSVHAEAAALWQLGSRGACAGKLELYVARVVDGRPALSLPCAQCQRLLAQRACVRRVFYSC